MVDFYISNNDIYLLYKNLNGFKILFNNQIYNFQGNPEKMCHLSVLNNQVCFFYFVNNNLVIFNFIKKYIIESVRQILKVFNNKYIIIEMTDNNIFELHKADESDGNGFIFRAFGNECIIHYI